ncbi:MAG: AMP-binding protein [Streptosporangiaceae bacterium]
MECPAAQGTPAGLLARHAADPARVFAIAEDEQGRPTVISYAQQLSRARAAAGALAALGVRPGDRVHVHTPNCPEFFDAWFATALLGAVLLPTGPQSTADELRYVLDQARPAVSLAAPGLREIVSAAAVTAGAAPRVIGLTGNEAGALPALAARAQPVPAPEPAGDTAGQPDTRTAAILYTSGTTSRPKGVLVTHANYLAVGAALAAHLAITDQDRWLIALPLFHANAQYYCTMSALVAGASIVLAPRFSASGWARQAAEHGATLGSLFAAPVRMILAQPPGQNEQRSSLRAVLFAQNLTDGQAAAFEQRFGTRLLQLYGMTETVLPPTVNPDSPERRWPSIGRALPGVTLRVAGENGTPVPPGTAGELLVRGVPGVTLAAGYYRDPDATAAAFRDGWLHTGDLARLDGDGFAYFVDRAKDMIKRSGENVSAGEIERVAAGHPAIAECAAIGVPDPVRDEAIVLIAVPAPGTAPRPDELIAWCAGRLAPYKVPASVVFTGALPRTSVGKIAKAQLRSQFLPVSPTASQARHQEDA